MGVEERGGGTYQIGVAERRPTVRQARHILEADADVPAALHGAADDAPCCRPVAVVEPRHGASSLVEDGVDLRDEPDLPGGIACGLDERTVVRCRALLKLANRGAQRRLRRVQAIRCPAEVELLSDGDEVAQMTELEHRDRVTLLARWAPYKPSTRGRVPYTQAV
jgi:hypothetical protein